MQKALTVTVDASGNVFVAGPMSEERPTDIFVAKLDMNGQVLWQRCLTQNAGSMPPPPPADFATAADPRDSVEPYLISELERHADKRSRWRNLALSAGAALMVAGAMVLAAAAADARGGHGAVSYMHHRTLRAEPGTAQLGWAAMAREPAAELLGTEPAVAAEVAAEDAVTDYEEEPELADELRRETLQLLGAGLPAEALPRAQAWVVADPTDALPHLCVGAALQDLGRARDARAAYSECVRQATHGNISECYALGGRK